VGQSCTLWWDSQSYPSCSHFSMALAASFFWRAPLVGAGRGFAKASMTKRAQVEAVMRSHDRLAHVRLVALSGQAQSAL
jgi:hypothetical protein